MTTKLRIKRSNVANKIPGVGDLAVGELAINFPDKKIYTRGPNGIVQLVGDAVMTDPNVGVSQTITPKDPNDIPLSVAGMAGQAVDLQQWRDVGKNVLAKINSTGQLTVAGLTMTADMALQGDNRKVSLSSANGTNKVHLQAGITDTTNTGLAVVQDDTAGSNPVLNASKDALQFFYNGVQALEVTGRNTRTEMSLKGLKANQPVVLFLRDLGGTSRGTLQADTNPASAKLTLTAYGDLSLKAGIAGGAISDILFANPAGRASIGDTTPDATARLKVFGDLLVTGAIRTTNDFNMPSVHIGGPVVHKMLVNAPIDTTKANRFRADNNAATGVTLTFTLPTGKDVVGEDYQVEGQVMVKNGATPGAVTFAGIVPDQVMGAPSPVANEISILTYLIQRQAGDAYTSAFIWSAP